MSGEAQGTDINLDKARRRQGHTEPAKLSIRDLVKAHAISGQIWPPDGTLEIRRIVGDDQLAQDARCAKRQTDGKRR